MTATVLAGRVAGLAAGVVISLAVSAPAATAEPGDTRSGGRSDARSQTASEPAGSATSVDAPDDRGARTVRRAESATRSGPAGQRRGVRPNTAVAVVDQAADDDLPSEAREQLSGPQGLPASAAVAVTGVPAVAVDAEPASASTSVSSAPVATAPESGAPVPGSSVANPSAAAAPEANWLASLLGCDPRGRRITIFKGTHFAIPPSLGYFTQKVSGTGTFTPDTVYDLKDEDQYDWNKFTGIAFTPLEPDRNSVMVGWRYNLATEEFEIAPFYNVDKKRILPDEQTEVISVPAGETFDYTVDYSGVRISYGGTTVYKPYPQGLKPNVWTASRVSGWFGGNETAPRTISYYLKFTR